MDSSIVIGIVTYIVSFIYQFLTYIGVIFTATLAISSIYLFLFKRNDILLRYELLLNYTFQMDTNDLLGYIGDLKHLDVDKEPQKVNEIFLAIQYQMKDHPIFKIKCKPILKTLSMFEKHPEKITNDSRIILMSRLKAQIRYINLKSYIELLGEQKK